MVPTSPQFTGETLQYVKNLRGDSRPRTTHEENSKVERIIGILKADIKKTCESDMTSWDIALPRILNGYRQLQSRDGLSPFEIMFGIQARSSHEPNINSSTISNTMVVHKAEIATALAMRAERVVRFSDPDARSIELESLCCSVTVPWGLVQNFPHGFG